MKDRRVINLPIMIVTLEDAKRHLIIEHNEDDNYITNLIDVAECSILDYCNWTYYSNPVPPPIKQAILLIVGNLYTNREPVSFITAYKIPYTVDFLIAPYITY